MTNNPPPEPIEYTPEQRKLLGKAYRLILSWPRDKATDPPVVCNENGREDVLPKNIIPPKGNAHAKPQKKRR